MGDEGLNGLRTILASNLLQLDVGTQSLGDPVELPPVALADLSGTSPRYRVGQAGRIVYVVDDPQGAQPAFADGSHWRRLRDGTVVS